MVAIIAGSTGLIGKELLQQLCKDPMYEQIIILVRRPSGYIHEKIREIITDFDHIESLESDLKGDVLFYCLGSTRHKTPDRDEYYKIDHDYPVSLAILANKNGVKQLHLVSSIGANPASGNFYLKMKGQTEGDISAIPFAATHIYRPSFLSGDRQEKRTLEKLGLKVFAFIKPLLIGKLRKYRSIEASVVAQSMIKNAADRKTGVHVYESDTIQRLGSY